MANLTFIAEYTFPSDAANYTFTTIPTTFTDLKLVWSFRNSSGGDALVTFNGVGSGYQYRSLFNVGQTGAAADTYGGNVTNGLVLQYLNTSGNIYTAGGMYIANYASGTQKTIWSDMARPNPSSTTGYSNVPMSHYWSNTATISSITIAGSPTIAAGSKFWLYGISNS